MLYGYNTATVFYAWLQPLQTLDCRILAILRCLALGSLQAALGSLQPLWAACTGQLCKMLAQTVSGHYSTITVFYA